MHDSDSGIGTDSGMIPFLAGIGIGIGIKNIKTELESDFWVNLESESELELCITDHYMYIACDFDPSRPYFDQLL